MKFKIKKRRYPVIPLSSTSDIGFLLLIFIMLVSLINYRKEIKIDYPEATKQEYTSAKKNFEIWIDRDGKVFYNGVPINSLQLENLLVDAITKRPDTRVHVIADKETNYIHINDVVEILKSLEHRVVSFVVREKDI